MYECIVVICVLQYIVGLNVLDWYITTQQVGIGQYHIFADKPILAFADTPV